MSYSEGLFQQVRDQREESDKKSSDLQKEKDALTLQVRELTQQLADKLKLQPRPVMVSENLAPVLKRDKQKKKRSRNASHDRGDEKKNLKTKSVETQTTNPILPQSLPEPEIQRSFSYALASVLWKILPAPLLGIIVWNWRMPPVVEMVVKERGSTSVTTETLTIIPTSTPTPVPAGCHLLQQTLYQSVCEQISTDWQEGLKLFRLLEIMDLHNQMIEYPRFQVSGFRFQVSGLPFWESYSVIKSYGIGWLSTQSVRSVVSRRRAA